MRIYISLWNSFNSVRYDSNLGFDKGFYFTVQGEALRDRRLLQGQLERDTGEEQLRRWGHAEPATVL